MDAPRVSAFIARVTARTGLLLCAERVNVSHPFREFVQAVRWADRVIWENKQAGLDPMYDGICMVQVPEEYVMPDPKDWGVGSL